MHELYHFPQARRYNWHPHHATFFIDTDTMSRSTVEVRLPDGPISAVGRGGILIARGIPYAHAKRFERPQPPTKWTTTLDCTKQSPICPQLESRLNAIMGPIAEGRAMSEDCLCVSIFVPSSANNATLPVMAWLHGGGYSSGSGDLDCYSGAGLASKGVVVVNINYRLGVLGYQPIRDRGIPANLGLMDQIAALTWIQENVSYFGGDPKQVCVFGESAGADSIYALLGANGTENLFHRVIMQSAPLGVRLADRHEMLDALESLAADVLPQDEKEVPFQELLVMQTKLAAKALSFATGIMPFGPIEGYEPLPDKSMFSKRLHETIHRVPIFVGYNADEGTAFVPIFERLDKGVLRTSDEVNPADFMSKSYFERPSDQFYNDLKEVSATSWLYKFTIAPSQSAWASTHTLELPFLLGAWEDWSNAPMLGGAGSRELVERVGCEMKKLWVAFASGKNVGKREFVIGEHFSFVT